MPQANDITAPGKAARILAWGQAKVRKTWWCLEAAKAGFNVVLFDGDDGWDIIKQIKFSPEALARISIVDCVDKQGVPVFKNFVDILARDYETFTWDEQAKCRALSTVPSHSYYSFDITKFTSDDVLVFDSHKALVWSTIYAFALQHNIDLADAKKIEWDGYGYEMNFLDSIINFFHKVRCHIIVVGHEVEYEKRAQKDGPGAKKGDVLWSRTQIKSSSNNHATSMLSHFSDVLWFHRTGAQSISINTGGEPSRIGGSRHFPPRDYDFERPQGSTLEILTAAMVLEAATGKASGAKCEGITFIPLGTPAHNIVDKKAQISVTGGDSSNPQQINLAAMKPLVLTPAKK